MSAVQVDTPTLAAGFLEILFDECDGDWIDVRLIEEHKGGNCKQLWFRGVRAFLDRLPSLADLAYREGRAVFFGVLPRAQRGNGTKSGCAPGWAIYADIDYKDVAQDEAEQRLRAFPAPSMVVQSGHGMHLYWLLQERADPPVIEEYSRRVASALGADSCFDSARILRLPGTRNLKEGWSGGTYTAPAAAPLVRLPVCDPSRRYQPHDFDFLPEAEPAPSAVAHVPRAGVAIEGVPLVVGRLLRKHEWLRALWNGEGRASGDTSNSGYDLALAGALTRCGVMDPDVLDAAVRARPYKGGGSKEGRTDRNVQRCVDRAIADAAARRPRETGRGQEPVEPPPGAAAPFTCEAPPAEDPGPGDAPPLPLDDDAPPADDDRPELVVSGDRVDVLARAWGAILAANDPPRWYSQGGAMVDIHAPPDAPESIRRLNPVMVGGVLCRVARVMRYDPRKGERTASQPPDPLVKDMHAYPDERLPVLDAIVRAPVLDREGRLVATPGYDRQSGLYYLPGPGMDRLDVSDLSASTVAAARDNILSQWLGEFPFEAVADRAHALALVLLPFARRMIAGPTPLHLVEAAERGTGKTLLAQVALAPYLGHAPDAMPLSDKDEEVRKGITSALMARKPVIFYDNLDGRVEAASLCAALTSTRWEDRVLGASALVSPPNNATWIATANNLEMSTDIARRSVRCRLNRRVERPWEYVARRGDLKAWTAANRRALVECALTLCLAWVRAGCPAGESKPLGSFEDWTRVLGGILHHAGVEGFLANAREVYDGADPVHAEWRALVVEWWHAHGTEPVSPAQLARLADEHDLLATVLARAGNSDRGKASRVGRGLAQQRGRVFAGLAFEPRAGRDGTVYALCAIDPAAAPTREPRPPRESTGRVPTWYD